MSKLTIEETEENVGIALCLTVKLQKYSSILSSLSKEMENSVR